MSLMHIESICLKAFKQIKPNVFDVQRNLLILGVVGGRERGILGVGDRDEDPWGGRSREGSLFHALSALEAPAARKVPSVISHGDLER